MAGKGFTCERGGTKEGTVAGKIDGARGWTNSMGEEYYCHVFKDDADDADDSDEDGYAARGTHHRFACYCGG